MTADEMGTALQPTRDALLKAAREDAQAFVDAADAAAARQLADAEALAADIRRDAAAEGEQAARAAVETAARQVRRDLRQALLGVRREAYEQLRTRVRAGARELISDPGYRDVLHALETLAVGRLGAAAEVQEAPGGGVVARLGARSMDLSLDFFIDAAIEACAPEVAALWE